MLHRDGSSTIVEELTDSLPSGVAVPTPVPKPLVGRAQRLTTLPPIGGAPMTEPSPTPQPTAGASDTPVVPQMDVADKVADKVAVGEPPVGGALDSPEKTVVEAGGGSVGGGAPAVAGCPLVWPPLDLTPLQRRRQGSKGPDASMVNTPKYGWCTSVPSLPPPPAPHARSWGLIH